MFFEFRGAKMRVNFAMWSTDRCGGVRAVFEIANRLSKKGHKVGITALGGDHGWFPLEVEVNYVELPLVIRILNRFSAFWHKKPLTLLDVSFRKSESRFAELARKLSEAIPDCDISVATWFHTALPVWHSNKGQRFYLMQDFPEQMKSRYDRGLFQTTLSLPMFFLTNSKYTKDIVLNAQPTARVKIVGAGVNTRIFYPRKKRVIDSGGRPIVMVFVRSEFFRGTDLAFKILNHVNKVFPIHAILVGKVPKETEMDFRYSSYEAVSDDELAGLYSTSDLFLFTSVAEGFGLPPLEAMACGVPVAMTDCGGNREYANQGYNCVMLLSKDVKELGDQIVKTLRDKKLLGELIKGGLETARKLTWDDVVGRIDSAFMKKGSVLDNVSLVWNKQASG
jgi:glycosyltransferase involved in cell wall biosynthesis